MHRIAQQLQLYVGDAKKTGHFSKVREVQPPEVLVLYTGHAASTWNVEISAYHLQPCKVDT